MRVVGAVGKPGPWYEKAELAAAVQPEVHAPTIDNIHIQSPCKAHRRTNVVDVLQLTYDEIESEQCLGFKIEDVSILIQGFALYRYHACV